MKDSIDFGSMEIPRLFRRLLIPTVLGKGVRLFPDMEQEFPLKLVGTEQYNGIVDLIYEKR